MEKQPRYLIEKLGLGRINSSYVLKLSGGQRNNGLQLLERSFQRHDILADEPTGNLDEGTAAEIIDILKMAAHERWKNASLSWHTARK